MTRRFHMLHPEHGEPVLLKTLKDAGYFVWWGGKNDLTPGQDGYEAFCDVKYPSSSPITATSPAITGWWKKRRTPSRIA
jgi:hypothetical protein